MPPKSKKASSSKRRLVFEDPEEQRESSSPTPPSSTTSPPRKRQRASFQSPPRKTKKATAVAVVTPADEESKEYVPKYIHKNVHYLRKNQGQLSSATRQAYDLVCEYYEIPANFEQSRSYGPLSGTTYEERVIQEYALGKLTAKDNAVVEICTNCAKLGHVRDDCPSLV